MFESVASLGDNREGRCENAARPTSTCTPCCMLQTGSPIMQTNKAYLKNPNSKQGWGWGHGFPRGIEERACGNSKGQLQLKKIWDFHGCSRKGHVEFPWHLVVDLGISKKVSMDWNIKLQWIYKFNSTIRLTCLKIDSSKPKSLKNLKPKLFISTTNS